MKLAQIESGVVVNIIEVDPKAIPDFAKGWPDVDSAGLGWGFDGKVFSAPPAAVVGKEQVDAERLRRLELGASFSADGAKEVLLQGRDKDKSVYIAQLMRAQGYKASGISDPAITLRDGNDVNWRLTPDQAIAIILQGMSWFEAVMSVSWDMKDGKGGFKDGIPADYADDRHWP